ncbi:hypothetical protein [Butyrivibrio sp. VCD2006]|uniref:hypothetical protein n=1 Tax=Butyrivibrio sp. VCD2006 TaxID=1280664 RepID=UPI00040D0A62|nr:hypothetical protein [Butyrivibrio sp. VCD2006]
MNYKKLIAFTMAVTMVFGSSITAFASETSTESDITANDTTGKTITGTGSEAFVDKNVMKVTVPTNLTNLFNYKVDPQGLVSATKSYDGTEVTGTATGVVFLNAAKTTGGKATISNESDPVKITNKSSIPVEIGIATTVEAATNGLALTTLADSADFTTEDNDDKALYLGLKSTNDREFVLNAATGTSKNILLSGADQYEAKWNTDKYEWVPKANAKFDEFQFTLTGAINTALDNSTWATVSDGTLTVKNPPKVSVKFTLEGVKDALDLGVLWGGDDIYVYKANGTKMDGNPEGCIVNGKTVTAANVKTATEGDYKDIVAVIKMADLATAFGYDYTNLTDEQKTAAHAEIKKYVKSVKITDNSKTYYGEF